MRLTHRVHRCDVFRQRRIAEPQLDRAEAVGEQLLRFVCERAVIVHQAEPATVVGGNGPRRAAKKGGERRAGGDRKRIPTGRVEARHRHAHDALDADQRETLGELRPELRRFDRVAFDHALDLAEQAHNRGDCRAQITEQIGAAGDALLRFEIDQEQRHLAKRAHAGAQHEIRRNFDRRGADSANGQAGKWGRFSHEKPD